MVKRNTNFVFLFFLQVFTAFSRNVLLNFIALENLRIRQMEPHFFLPSLQSLFFPIISLLNIYVLRFSNPLMTIVPHPIETSQLTCNADQLTGFYMMENIGRY